MERILIAADGRRPSSLLEQSLRASRYMTKVARDRGAAAKLVGNEAFDMFILDLEAPVKEWGPTLRKLREADPRLPLMVLAPRDEARETVTALEREADECVVKPFGIEELLTRVRARLRERKTPKQRFMRAGGIALDLDTRTVEKGGQPVELTDRELSLLEILMRHPDEVLSRERLLSHAWGDDYDPGSNVVAGYVGYLRSKLGAETIETVRGGGYRLRD
jgi:DNA-binding response OmpR family regulator